MPDMEKHAVARDMEKELSFYKSEYERLNKEHIELEEKHRNVWNDAGKMYDENLRLKREVDSLKLVFRLLLNKED